MTIYRNKSNNLLYTIEHLVLDVRFTNRNENAGIYAHPYNWKGDKIVYRNRNYNQCSKFIENNFIEIAYV